MTGKSYQELQDMMSKGKIGVDAVSAALQHATGVGGMFHGMMEEQSKTVSGKWSTAIGLVQQRAVDVYDKIQPFILQAIDLFQDVSGSVLDVVDSIALWATDLQPVWDVSLSSPTLQEDCSDGLRMPYLQPSDSSSDGEQK